jgi:aminoglycoside phosphotransferase (APT) family kinase protein
MPEPSFVTHVARTVYGLEPQSIESLEQFQFDWRGIYRVQDAQEGSWVIRLLHLPNVVDSLAHTARLLDWLTHQQYPAPSVRVAMDQQLVSTIDGWAITVLSYVDGTVLGAHSADDLGALAQTLGRLHTLRVDDSHVFTKSRCHSDHIAIAAQQLASNSTKVPQAFHSLLTDLHTSMLALQQQRYHDLCITHGDCWYMNAIKAPDGSVILIDWDQAGIGLPLLDLGNLLLTSHFDLNQPLCLAADDSKIKAIMHGYQQQCHIVQHDKESMANAMRFLLAFQLGSYVADNALFLNPDFSFVLQKLQARYNVTRDIADIAIQYFE